MLNNPLPQSPSFRDILDELEAEYQHVTNDTNNTGNAWQTNTYTLTTTAGQYDYQIVTDNDDFFKALSVTTVPENVDADPQYVLEFTEFEHLPKEWAWLGQNKGQYMTSSHDSQLIAFYRKIATTGEQIWCRLAPTPAQTQDYTILYQVTDWWPLVDASNSRTWKLPHSSQRFYIRSLVAQNLLMSGRVRWSYDNLQNYKMGELVEKGLEIKLKRYEAVYNEYKDSLDNPDIVMADAWADEAMLQYDSF